MFESVFLARVPTENGTAAKQLEGRVDVGVLLQGWQNGAQSKKSSLSLTLEDFLMSRHFKAEFSLMRQDFTSMENDHPSGNNSKHKQ